jgi:hypothetical protein
VGIEDRLSAIEALLQTMQREQRARDAERQHQAGRWGSRQEAGRHLAVGLDAVDAMIARGELRVERIGPPPVERRDRLGRRIDRRRVRVWLVGPPKSEAEIAQIASEARAR